MAASITCRCHYHFLPLLDIARMSLKTEMEGRRVSSVSETEEEQPWVVDAPQQMYLAQVPIMNIENEERAELKSLRNDILTPAFLDSKGLSSINLWMNSSQTRSSTHCDPHHNLLCVVAGRKQGQNQVLCKTSAGASSRHIDRRSDESGHTSSDTCRVKSSQGNKLNQRIMLHELEPFALHSLHELISLVHGRISVADPGQPVDSVVTASAVLEQGKSKKLLTADLYELEDDPVANIIWTLQPLILQKIFLAMVHFPRTLEALVLHLLSPVGAEVLTRKFEEMDQLTVEEGRNEFCQTFYGVFDDQFAAMDVLLIEKNHLHIRHLRMCWINIWELKFEGAKPQVG